MPKKLEEQFTKGSTGLAVATRFRLRILTTSSARASPSSSSRRSSPSRPAPRRLRPPAVPRDEGDCDKDGQLNGVDADDDNDLLSDAPENDVNPVLVAKYGPGIAVMNTCSADTDGDGVEDGYEYRSAVTSTTTSTRRPNTFLPYPGKKPYANPLFDDADTDHDGDSLTLAEE